MLLDRLSWAPAIHFTVAQCALITEYGMYIIQSLNLSRRVTGNLLSQKELIYSK